MKRAWTTEPFPWRSLGYAVIEQAVNDVKGLILAGVVRDWQLNEDNAIVKYWRSKHAPGDYTRVHVLGYSNPDSVVELLYDFVGGEIADWLELLGSDMTVKRIIDGIEATAVAQRSKIEALAQIADVPPERLLDLEPTEAPTQEPIAESIAA